MVFFKMRKLKKKTWWESSLNSESKGPYIKKNIQTKTPPVSTTSFCSNLPTTVTGKGYSHFVEEKTKAHCG